ncbi:potassium-transporting ATPase subunit KdpC [Martelella alba]|uniref:Potassium-transporting ATPase KdpC subunit n=1 Tax=Martelella alba TaxID=2590451 RepID=A0A506U1Q6_9HYPH|nr:potassium-transporting ATPase subunit KdpC [Martelella alba]TPW27201.1 potassium-transporting ATPase subunit KdpC [Martelella alba]
MFTLIRPALGFTLIMTVLTGLGYPLAMTGLAGFINRNGAQGSLLVADGHVVGSALIGQSFSGPRYFHPRPSAVDYDAAAAGASNLGPSSATLVAEVAKRRAAYREANNANAPIDAVTSSASGLDPDISVENARNQAARVATARGLRQSEVDSLIDGSIARPLFGLYGTARVNVLALNLALDKVAVDAPVQKN